MYTVHVHVHHDPHCFKVLLACLLHVHIHVHACIVISSNPVPILAFKEMRSNSCTLYSCIYLLCLMVVSAFHYVPSSAGRHRRTTVLRTTDCNLLKVICRGKSERKLIWAGLGENVICGKHKDEKNVLALIQNKRFGLQNKRTFHNQVMKYKVVP